MLSLNFMNTTQWLMNNQFVNIMQLNNFQCKVHLFKRYSTFTWFDKKLLNILSNSADITTSPLIALWSSSNVKTIRIKSLLNLSHS